MINLFACDLDGTLLNLLHVADNSIRRALREVTGAGAHFAVATGRTMHNAYELGCDGIPMDLIGSNGSIIRSGTGELLTSFPIDKDALAEMLRALPQVCFECVTPDGTYVTGSPEDRAAGFRNDHPIRRIIMRGMRGKRSMLEAEMVFNQTPEQILRHDVCKVNCRISDEHLRQELIAYLREHRDQVVDAPFMPRMFEITQVGVDKGAAVAWLAEHYGVAADEVAVYGDGGNDIAMLERFEHAYAPRNGSEAAKRAAGTVIGHYAFYAVPRHMVATVRRERRHIQIA